jgi:hypothetical protein
MPIANCELLLQSFQMKPIKHSKIYQLALNPYRLTTSKTTRRCKEEIERLRE